MKDSLVIKSSPYGLTLYLNREIPFEDLVREVCIKFAGAKTFFVSATLALSFEGRELTTEEAAVLVEAVELNSDLRISMVLENDETKNREEKKKIDRIYYENTLEHAKIIRGSIKSGQEVSFDTSVVILGNVKPRAKVMAKGNIIIFGSLEGEALAGIPEDNHCFIVAEEVTASIAQIGTCRDQLTLNEKWYRRVRRRENEALAIAVWQDRLCMEPLKGGLLKKI